MCGHEKAQVAASAAQVYEEFFVEALFGQWPEQVLDSVGVREGEHLLDIACGTGVVARGHTAAVSWQIGSAQSLPFEEGTFDRVTCQFGLMFFPDRIGASPEMARVLKSTGRGCIAVWTSLEDTPGYHAVASLLNDLFGAQISQSIEAPYSLGNIDLLRSLLAEAGLNDVCIEGLPGKARFDSIAAWLYTDIKGWTLADVIDDDAYARLQHAAPEYLGEFVGEDGRVDFDAPAHLMSFSA